MTGSHLSPARGSTPMASNSALIRVNEDSTVKSTRPGSSRSDRQWLRRPIRPRIQRVGAAIV